MLKLSALLSLLRLHLQAHELGNASVSPAIAGTIARLLSAGEQHAKDMEAALPNLDAAPVDLSEMLGGNVVSLAAFLDARASRNTTPAGDPA